MTSNPHGTWKRDTNKDKLASYQDSDFQRDYIELEMDSKADMFQQKSKSMVKEVMRQIWRKSPNRNFIRILSLGCGPGSDLLGILRAVDSVLQTDPKIGWKCGELECHCTGVDAFHWDRGKFEQKVDELYNNGCIGDIVDMFHCMKMEDFVHDSSEPSGLIADRFDFICMSFADAGRNLQLVGTALPQLLTESGRVLVLDNNIPTVRRLAEFGYKYASCGRICMHSRGRGKKSSILPYKPSPSSSVLIFELHVQMWIARQELGHSTATQAQLLEAKRQLEELVRFDQEFLSATSLAQLQQSFQRHNLRC